MGVVPPPPPKPNPGYGLGKQPWRLPQTRLPEPGDRKWTVLMGGSGFLSHPVRRTHAPSLSYILLHLLTLSLKDEGIFGQTEVTRAPLSHHMLEWLKTTTLKMEDINQVESSASQLSISLFSCESFSTFWLTSSLAATWCIKT